MFGIAIERHYIIIYKHEQRDKLKLWYLPQTPSELPVVPMKA